MPKSGAQRSKTSRENHRKELLHGRECPCAASPGISELWATVWDWNVLEVWILPGHTKAHYGIALEQLREAIDSGDAVILCQNCRAVERGR